MIAAFSGVTFGSAVGLQEFGLGLLAAILLDATVVRAVLVPAVMKLLGDWNGYLPARLRRCCTSRRRRRCRNADLGRGFSRTRRG
jgi:RND superfamily putative drug exporter